MTINRNPENSPSALLTSLQSAYNSIAKQDHSALNSEIASLLNTEQEVEAKIPTPLLIPLKSLKQMLWSAKRSARLIARNICQEMNFKLNLALMLNLSVDGIKEFASQKNKVLVVGKTRAGNSTLINVLCGIEYSPKINEDSGERYLEIISEQKKEFANIRHDCSINSTTLYPQMITQPDITYCDSPGYGFRGNTETEMTAALGVPLVVQETNVSVLIVTIPWNLTDVSGTFFSALQNLTLNIASTVKDLNNSRIVFAITSPPLCDSKEIFDADKLRKQALARLRLLPTGQLVKAILKSENVFVIRGHDQLIEGDKPDHKEALINCINALCKPSCTIPPVQLYIDPLCEEYKHVTAWTNDRIYTLSSIINAVCSQQMRIDSLEGEISTLKINIEKASITDLPILSKILQSLLDDKNAENTKQINSIEEYKKQIVSLPMLERIATSLNFSSTEKFAKSVSALKTAIKQLKSIENLKLLYQKESPLNILGRFNFFNLEQKSVDHIKDINDEKTLFHKHT